MLANLDRAREALQAIPPDLPRDEWVRAGMAAQAAGLGFDDFNEWSAGAGNYDERAALATWRSIKPGKGIGEGTLYRMAAEHGGYGKRRERPSKAPARPVEPAKAPRPGMSAAEVWARCRPATEAHGYIVKKDGRPEGLRVVPEGDPLRIQGESVAGCLVVPVLPLAGGEPVSLVFVPSPEVADRWKAKDKPGKLNLKGAPMDGVFIVGELVPGGIAYVCEGIATAWACWKATGFAAVVAFGWSNVRRVAAELRQRDASARLVLVPDKGKEEEAETIAREVGAAVAAMPEGEARNFDANDYALREGIDALEVLLSSASEPPKPEPRFKLLGRDDIAALPPLAWRVRGVLPTVGVAALFGPSASGKSFLAFDLAAHIAEGREWFAYRVTAAPVVYVVLEGEAGFKLRAEAWEQAHGRKLPAGLRLVLQGFKLTGDVPDLAAAILAAVGAGAVVFVDTLNRAAPMADENSSRDMGEILEGTKELQRLTAGLVVLVHHTGKDAARGLRGHSSLFAALDAAVEVTRDGERKEWKVSKAKDGADGDAHPFRLEVVQLPQESDGEPVSSCVVRRDMGTADVARVKLPQGGNQRIVLDALRPMFKASPRFGMGGAPASRPCIELEPALCAAGAALPCASDRRTERTREAITGLVARGVLGCGEGWLWLT
ncbi:MAG: AAA family ATPase [Ideonella sp. WA131b]|nr:AAA family ATPase [Ideonella sp. WA131b]